MFGIFKNKTIPERVPKPTAKEREQLFAILDHGNNYQATDTLVRLTMEENNCTNHQACDILLKTLVDSRRDAPKRMRDAMLVGEMKIIAYKLRKFEQGEHTTIELDLDFLAAKHGIFMG